MIELITALAISVISIVLFIIAFNSVAQNYSQCFDLFRELQSITQDNQKQLITNTIIHMPRLSSACYAMGYKDLQAQRKKYAYINNDKISYLISLENEEDVHEKRV